MKLKVLFAKLLRATKAAKCSENFGTRVLFILWLSVFDVESSVVHSHKHLSAHCQNMCSALQIFFFFLIYLALLLPMKSSPSSEKDPVPNEHDTRC